MPRTRSHSTAGRRGEVNPHHVAQLATEQLNPASDDLDLKSTTQILRILNRADQTVPRAVQRVLPAVAKAVDAIVASFQQGGRLIYVGAGTSGRLGVLDASECPPTYNTPAAQVVGVIAGGSRALEAATETTEDDPKLGAAALRRLRVNRRDTVVGIAASGRTPFTLGALHYARSRGARTVALVCVPHSPMEQVADLAIVPLPGAEVISGSTRLKAGTAQKLVLNMLSTASMVRTGKVFGNLMVNVHQKNAKLRARAVNILAQAAGIPRTQAQNVLRRAEGDLRVAIVMAVAATSAPRARAALQVDDDLRAALGRLQKGPNQPVRRAPRAAAGPTP